MKLRYAATLCAALLLGLNGLSGVSASGQTAGEGQADGSSAVAPTAIEEDAAQMAKSLGIDPDLAIKYIEQQPNVWDLEGILHADVASFAGMYIDYRPTYRIVVLTTGPEAEMLTSARAAASDAISGSVVVRRVDYSEQTLRDTIRMIAAAAPGASFGADASIETGVVSLRAETPRDATQLRSVLPSLDLPTELEAIDVTIAAHGFAITDEVCDDSDDVCGGEYLHDNDVNPHCTAGFTVNDGQGHEGTATAAHCDNMLKHEGVALDFQGRSNGYEHDIQWHLTPDLADLPKARDGDSTPRDITAALSRANQTVNTWVCKYGDTTGYTCGELKSKIYQPPQECTMTNSPTATYMRVKNPDGENLSEGGDSGGPWYAGNTAFGFHKGSPCDWSSDQAYYMAQDLVSVLGVSISLA